MNVVNAISFDQVASLIAAVGHTNTIIVEGDVGIGKSTLLLSILDKKPTHAGFYCDCTTLNPEDMFAPNLKAFESGVLKFIPNEALGLHVDGPSVVMYDEWGKNRGIHNATLRDLHERKLCNIGRHPDSIVFATTNLSSEGIGDIIPPHGRNRVTVVRMRKPYAEEWLVWATNNGIEPSIMSWVKDEGTMLFQSFTSIKDPDENPYIYHPRAAGRTAFVTPRSLHKASDIIKGREFFDSDTLTAALIGTLGERGALDFSARLKLQDDLPTYKQIVDGPATAKVPGSAAAVCMVVFRALTMIEPEHVDPWMVYLRRLDKEAQGLFANGVRSSKYSKRGMVMSNRSFGKWALENNYMFAADKV